MRRHELMMKKILQNVAVHSLLCFSNGKIIIEGKENFTDYPIVTVEQLEEKLSEICSQQIYSDSEIVDIVNLINEHKVNVSR